MYDRSMKIYIYIYEFWIQTCVGKATHTNFIFQRYGWWTRISSTIPAATRPIALVKPLTLKKTICIHVIVSSSDLTWTFFNGHQETMAPIGHRQICWHLVVAMCTLVMRIQRPLQNVAVQVILLQCVRRMVQKRSSKPSTRKVLQGCNLPLKLLNPSWRRRRSSNGTQQHWLRMSLIESTVYDLPQKWEKLLEPVWKYVYARIHCKSRKWANW